MSDLTAQMDLRQLAADMMRELDSLRARLAECERERDEARGRAFSSTPWNDLLAERDAAIQRAAMFERMYDEALKRYQPAEADTVARIVAWLDDPEGEPISHEMLRGYGLQDYSQRVETCRDMLAEMIKAGAWRGKEGA